MTEQKIMATAKNIPPDILWRISSGLTALFIHEINNDLATLREKAGLAEDVLAARKISDSDKLKSMGEIVNSCESRLHRAVALVRSLSQIGKDMGSDSGVADLGSLLKSLAPFFEKIARQQLLSIRMAVGPGLFVVASRPYPLLCCILALFDNQCRQSVPGEDIVIETKQESTSVILSLSARRKREQNEESLPWTEAALSTLAEALGISLKYTEEGDRVSLFLSRS
jgi:hypothetical protein